MREILIVLIVLTSQMTLAQVRYQGVVLEAKSQEPLIFAPIINLEQYKVWRTDLDGRYTISGDSSMVIYVQYIGYQRTSKRLVGNDTIYVKAFENDYSPVRVIPYPPSSISSLFTGNLEKSVKDSLNQEKSIHYKINRLLSKDSTQHIMTSNALSSFSVNAEFGFNDQTDVISYTGTNLSSKFYLYDLHRDSLIKIIPKNGGIKLLPGIYEVYLADKLESYLDGEYPKAYPIGILFNDTN